MYVVSFRFISKQRKTLLRCLLWYFDYNQGSFGSRYVLNFYRSLNKRRMSPAQTITTEWTAEKCLDKRQTTNNKQTPKHKLGNRTNRWSKVQAEARYPSGKKQFKRQQQQQCRLKDDLIFSLRISREFRFTQFVYTVRDIPNRICRAASNFEKEILKSVLV